MSTKTALKRLVELSTISNRSTSHGKWYTESGVNYQNGGTVVGQALIILVSMLILGAGSFALLLLTGVIRIKQYAPPQAGANFSLIVGIIVILSFFAMLPYAFYPAIGSLILVGLGVLATAVVFHDNKRQKQERQTDRGKSRLYKLAPKQPQPKEAREE